MYNCFEKPYYILRITAIAATTYEWLRDRSGGVAAPHGQEVADHLKSEVSQGGSHRPASNPKESA